jgi:hypothetical protein
LKEKEGEGREKRGHFNLLLYEGGDRGFLSPLTTIQNRGIVFLGLKLV